MTLSDSLPVPAPKIVLVLLPASVPNCYLHDLTTRYTQADSERNLILIYGNCVNVPQAPNMDVDAFLREQDRRMNLPDDDFDEYLNRMGTHRRRSAATI